MPNTPTAEDEALQQPDLISELFNPVNYLMLGLGNIINKITSTGGKLAEPSIEELIAATLKKTGATTKPATSLSSWLDQLGTSRSSSAVSPMARYTIPSKHILGDVASKGGRQSDLVDVVIHDLLKRRGMSSDLLEGMMRSQGQIAPQWGSAAQSRAANKFLSVTKPPSDYPPTTDLLSQMLRKYFYGE